jgi:hypothetical protein
MDSTNKEIQGLFLRSVRLCLDNTRNTERVWSSPCPLKIQPGNFYRIWHNLYSRLHHVQLDTGVKGLAVCCSNAKNIGIHALSNTSRDYEMFIKRIKKQSNNRHVCWMFFPINTGESIRQVWIRHFKDCEGEASNPVIVVS